MLSLGLLRFRYFGAALSEERYASLAARPGWRAASMDLGSGLTVRGLLRRPLQEDAPWVLFFPGNSDTQLEESQRFLDALLDGQSFGAAVFTYRGFDGSPGTPERDAILSDANVVYASLLERGGIHASRAHVVGFSLGTFPAAAVAHLRPKTLSLLAPFTNVVITGSSLRRRLFPENYDLRPHVKGIDTPTMVIHGAKDTVLPSSMGREIATTIGARFMELPDADHTGVLGAKPALDAIREAIAHAGR